MKLQTYVNELLFLIAFLNKHDVISVFEARSKSLVQYFIEFCVLFSNL